jgi:CheY-like chemotaxis protein
MEVSLDRGYGLCCAGETAEAVRTLEADPPTLVVVDVDLADGRALVRTLRSDERWRSMLLVGVTATNNPMVTVTLDAPVFFKPDLDGLEVALAAYLRAPTRVAGGPPPAPYLA